MIFIYTNFSSLSTSKRRTTVDKVLSIKSKRMYVYLLCSLTDIYYLVSLSIHVFTSSRY